MQSDSELISHISDFLSSIGIEVIDAELPDDTFLPGLHILGSTILMDRSRLKHPGDLLHEAGHIAATEESQRALIGKEGMSPNWPDDGDELVAILWSYAALTHLQLSPETVFHSDGYKGDSQWLIEQFQNGVYIGMPLLKWMGFVEREEQFPVLDRWLR